MADCFRKINRVLCGESRHDDFQFTAHHHVDPGDGEKAGPRDFCFLNPL